MVSSRPPIKKGNHVHLQGGVRQSLYDQCSSFALIFPSRGISAIPSSVTMGVLLAVGSTRLVCFARTTATILYSFPPRSRYLRRVPSTKTNTPLRVPRGILAGEQTIVSQRLLSASFSKSPSWSIAGVLSRIAFLSGSGSFSGSIEHEIASLA